MKSGGRYLYQLNPTVRAHEPFDVTIAIVPLLPVGIQYDRRLGDCNGESGF